MLNIPNPRRPESRSAASKPRPLSRTSREGPLRVDFTAISIAGMAHGVLNGFLSDLENRRSDGRIELQGRVHIQADIAGEPLAHAAQQAVERRTQAGALHRGWIELIAVCAHVFHDGFEDFLDLLDAPASL